VPRSTPHPSLEALAIGLIAIATRSFHTEHAPLYDELYHLLAARSFATDGSLAIGQGAYTRAADFTILTGWMFERFGVGLTVARLLPIFSGSLLVVSLFLWTRSVAGRGAAWTAALLLSFSPNAIVLSQYIRPYAPHALLFFWGAIGLHTLVSGQARSGRWRLGVIASTVICLGAALRLQVTTLIGLAGLSPWLLIASRPAWAASFAWLRRYRAIGIGLLGLTAAGAIALVETGIAGHLLELAQEQPLWAQSSKFHVYHWIFLKYYPTLWSLLPLAWLFAIARRGEPALFCVSLFTVSLLLHVFFPIRGERYIAYLMPFFFALWGMVLAEAVPQLGGTALAALRQVLPGYAPSGRTARAVQGLTVAVSIAFLLVSNSAFFNAAKVIARGPVQLHPQYQVDWAAARALLRPLAARADLVVATNALSAYYHLDRVDVEFSATHLSELRESKQFSVDHRTGRPVISEAASLRQLMACYPTGLVVSEGWQWKNRVVGIDEGSAELLLREAERVELPPQANLIAFRWQRPKGEPPDGPCRSLRERVGAVTPPGPAATAG
jgi:hypothetical protein